MPGTENGGTQPRWGGTTGVWITPPEVMTRLFGISPAERLRRAFAGDATVWTSDHPPPAEQAHQWILLRGDFVFDSRLLDALRETRDVVLVSRAQEGAIPVAAHICSDQLSEAVGWIRDGKPALTHDIAVAGPDDLVHPYDSKLRKHQPAFVSRVEPEAAPELEQALFDAAYKNVTDWITRSLWPRPALALTRILARYGVAPNTVTLANWLLVIGATGAFLSGAFGIGLAAAWAMTFLDTVDGKLARVTLRSSRIGDLLDHGLDLIHPPFWWWAFGSAAAALPGALAGEWIPLATWTCVAGYVAGRLLEGAFLVGFGFEIHSFRPLDSWFRRITARRNPNLVLLSAATLVGAPELGVLAVAAWTLISIGFHFSRLTNASVQKARGLGVVPWQEEEGWTS
ncbi:MAG: CDP-alcohol phosphatidyltransferase family protein [bacterium]|nr:CDP-alcohol phosphatidyltransferase family protein [bacterium]MCP5066268.1 CDP-alcohol phosphatidyltransferase family protein [bacterium]